MAEETISTGELNRTMERVAKETGELRRQLETGFVRADIYQERTRQVDSDLAAAKATSTTVADMAAKLGVVIVQLETMRTDIASINESRKWQVRAVGTAIIAGLGSVIFTVLKLVP